MKGSVGRGLEIHTSIPNDQWILRLSTWQKIPPGKGTGPTFYFLRQALSPNRYRQTFRSSNAAIDNFYVLQKGLRRILKLLSFKMIDRDLRRGGHQRPISYGFYSVAPSLFLDVAKFDGEKKSENNLYFPAAPPL